MNKVVEAFNTAAQDSNPGSRSRQYEALPQSHCALRTRNAVINLYLTNVMFVSHVRVKNMM